jgi:hypothetical protein
MRIARLYRDEREQICESGIGTALAILHRTHRSALIVAQRRPAAEGEFDLPRSWPPCLASIQGE